MLIITPAFGSPYSQEIYLRISQFKSLSVEVTQLMGFPTTVIPGRKKGETSAESSFSIVACKELFGTS